MAGGLDLGPSLRALRIARLLSLGAAAEAARVSKSGIAAWEAGTVRPRGPALARLLDALEAEPRLRARLLHAADPRHARLALAATPLGAPVDVGAVIRAMRGRRGTTQADLARDLRVSQSAVARWESGDDAPSGETLQAAALALGATPEETLALACAQSVVSGRLPDGLFPGMEALAPHIGLRLRRGPLYEVSSLGLEAELWPRAARDARWDPVLAFVLGDRAVQLFLHGRLGEAEEAGRRALRLARHTPLLVTHAFSARLEVATVRGADAAFLARRIEAWAARLPDGAVKGWMQWEQALRLAEMGRPREAIDLTRRSVEHGGADPTASLLEVEVRAGRADRAESLLSDYVAMAKGPVPDAARFAARIAHARGEAADEATLPAMREEWRPWSDKDNWYTRHKLERIEREQARLART